MGLVNERESIQEKIDQVLSKFDKLEEACLLSQDESTVKMHDLIRDISLQVAGSRFVVKNYLAREDFLNEKNWSTYGLDVSVFMFTSDLFDGVIHISPKWPKLTTFVLQYFENVSACFFEHVHGLKVLDLSTSSKVRVFPKSISYLRNLTSLLLRMCIRLENLPSLSELNALERLDLYDTAIQDAPEGLEKLINLRYLNLGSTKLESVPLKAIGALSNLKYLNVTSLKVRSHEMIGLKKIETLEADFGNVCDFNDYVRHMNLHAQLNAYKINVGGDVWMFDHLCGKSVNLVRIIGDVLELPNDITFLCFYEVDNIRVLFDVIPSPLNSLEELTLCRLMDFRCLMS